MKFINKVTSEFAEKVKLVSANLGIDPSWLMLAINLETAGTFSPRIKNPNSTAVGLIQFTSATAKSLGTSTNKIEKMSALEQLDLVERYFKPYKGKMKNAFDVYWCIFFPKAVNEDSNFILQTSVLPASVVAKANPVFDSNGDGMIQKGEVEEVLVRDFEYGEIGAPGAAKDFWARASVQQRWLIIGAGLWFLYGLFKNRK